MDYHFVKYEDNELRMKIEKGKIVDATLLYKDGNGMRMGIEELKKRGLYKPDAVAEALLNLLA